MVTAPASQLPIVDAEIPKAAVEEHAGPSATMADVCRGMMWRISPSTLALCLLDDWSPNQNPDEESDVERSPQETENNQPAEMATTIPLETTEDIAGLTADMSRLEKL